MAIYRTDLTEEELVKHLKVWAKQNVSIYKDLGPEFALSFLSHMAAYHPEVFIEDIPIDSIIVR